MGLNPSRVDLFKALYGVTQLGGAANFGALFKLATDGSNYAVAVNFIGNNGKYAGGTLALDQNGDFYGFTPNGGQPNSGTVYCFGAAKVPRITSALFIGANYGQNFNYQITATLNPTSFDATGLPPGLTINNSTGAISGTFGAAGNFAVLLSATNAAGTGNATLSLGVSPAQATVTLGQLSYGYDGTPKPVSVTTAPAGISVALRYNSSATPPTNAGSYAVVADH